MNFDFTTVVALDAEHVREFRMAWPLWAKHKPELLERPMLVLADPAVSIVSWRRHLAPFFSHPMVRIVHVQMPESRFAATQRHTMLSSFVFSTLEYIESPYYLKLDTDTFATRADATWIRREWFDREVPIVAPAWGYTKPGRMIQELNQWAENISEFSRAGTPPIDVPVQCLDGRFRHARFISWLMFGNVAFTRSAASLCRSTRPLLPVSSQDTFLYYVAHRLGHSFVNHRFQRHGWGHSRRQLRRHYAQFLAHSGVAHSDG